MSSPEEEFYVGYLDQAPPALARSVRARIALVLILALGAGALVAASQTHWEPGRFELGVERDFGGVYVHEPSSQLRVERPGGGWSRWLLVRPGKFGGNPEWSSLDGRTVELRATLVHSGERTLLEVVPGSLAADSSEPVPSAPVEALGTVSLRGEIVDSKCWLGVMNPGNLRTHRACATLCIRGGIPPILIARDGEGRSRTMLLVGPEGEALNRQVLPLVALPVEVHGELERHDDLLVLRADPAAMRVLERE